MKKELDHITFWIKADSNKQLAFESVWELHEQSIIKRLDSDYSEESMRYIKSFLWSWYTFVMENVELESPLQPGQWHEFFVEGRFPRFAVRACINVGI